MKTLNENETVLYRVVCDNNILLEGVARSVAENFVSSLSASAQQGSRIVPMTQDGKEVLLG